MNPSEEKFQISNVHLSAEFDRSGLLQAVTTLSDRVRTEAKLEFWEYGTTRKSDKSGAYLFLPGQLLMGRNLIAGLRLH